MYLMYVDECGDSGMNKGSSQYFMLSAIVLHESQWTNVLTKIANAKSDLARKYSFPKNAELHAGEMLGRTSKQYAGTSKLNRALLLRDFVMFEKSLSDSVRILNVVNDKHNKPFGHDVFGETWDALINRFENTIEHGNFPKPPNGTGTDQGLIIVDETDEKKLRDLIRKMRHSNTIKSMYGDGTVRHDLKFVIEDPLHKRSDTSLLIQACDVNAYFLKQTIDPNSTVQKYKIKNLFYSLEPLLLKQASRTDELGIVWR